MQAALPADDWQIAEAIVTDLRSRVERMVEVGLDYLTLGTGTPSLSAGKRSGCGWRSCSGRG